ncbi:hypothetical protein ABIF74_011803 [Bradyrhizobium japonicum]
MGDVYWGLHAPLAACAARLGIRSAIESGSFYGLGALQLASLFSRVWSIERSQALHGHCQAHYSDIKNLTFLLGDSPDEIVRISNMLEEPIFFFLDAHWFPSTALSDLVRSSDCPLLSELEAIHQSAALHRGSVIVIDDADMFIGSLDPSQFRVSDFPSIAVILSVLKEKMGAEYVDVFDDVIIAGPKSFVPLVENYLRLRASCGAPSFKQLRR